MRCLEWNKRAVTNDELNVSLRDYVDMRINDLQKQLEMHIAAIQQQLDRRIVDANHATDLARQQMDKRLEGMNEFRQQLSEQANKFITREEVQAKQDAYIPAINENQRRLSILETTQANMQGRMWAIGVGFTIITVAINIALHFIH